MRWRYIYPQHPWWLQTSSDHLIPYSRDKIFLSLQQLRAIRAISARTITHSDITFARIFMSDLSMPRSDKSLINQASYTVARAQRRGRNVYARTHTSFYADENSRADLSLSIRICIYILHRSSLALYPSRASTAHKRIKPGFTTRRT